MAKSIQAQLAELEKHLEMKFQSAMEEEVNLAVTQVGMEKVQSSVYDAYTPKEYERTGLLLGSWEGTPLKMGISVRNTREAEDGAYIPKIIETGEGYSITGYPTPYDYETPRPFIQDTKDHLAMTKKHVTAFKEGLERQGIKTK